MRSERRVVALLDVCEHAGGIFHRLGEHVERKVNRRRTCIDERRHILHRLRQVERSIIVAREWKWTLHAKKFRVCLLYTTDAADELTGYTPSPRMAIHA